MRWTHWLSLEVAFIVAIASCGGGGHGSTHPPGSGGNSPLVFGTSRFGEATWAASENVLASLDGSAATRDAALDRRLAPANAKTHEPDAREASAAIATNDPAFGLRRQKLRGEAAGSALPLSSSAQAPNAKRSSLGDPRGRTRADPRGRGRRR